MIHYLGNISGLRVAATDNQRIFFYHEKSLSILELKEQLQNIHPFGLEHPFDLSLNNYQT